MDKEGENGGEEEGEAILPALKFPPVPPPAFPPPPPRSNRYILTLYGPRAGIVTRYELVAFLGTAFSSSSSATPGRQDTAVAPFRTAAAAAAAGERL